MITKIRMNISISEDTRERLQTYAAEHHTTVSQAITDWIWSQPLKAEKDEDTGVEEK